MNIKGKVIICDAIDEIGIKSLKNAGLTVDYFPEISAQDLISKVSEYDVIVVRSRTKITKEVIQNAKKAKIIARVGVGLDNIDTEEAEKQNIDVINAGEASITAVSELVMGFMLSLCRNIPIANYETKKGNWIKKNLIGTELKGKYLGIIGLGKIGRNVARLARGLRMNLIGYDIVPIDKRLCSRSITNYNRFKNSAGKFGFYNMPCSPYRTNKTSNKQTNDFKYEKQRIHNQYFQRRNHRRNIFG